MPLLKKRLPSADSSIHSNHIGSDHASSVAPPSYSSTTTGENAPPPSFTRFPTSYRINETSHHQFVESESLLNHLKLLGAFHALQQKVELCDMGIVAPLDPKARWTVFVTIAVHRLELYIDQILPNRNLANTSLPLDVALVLHAYSLNPRWFQEDKIRIHPQVDALGANFWDVYAQSIDTATQEQMPTANDRENWFSTTMTPFDPIESLQTAQGRWLRDPWSRSQQPVFVPWVTADGKGYAQQGFKVQSGAGGIHLTHETLGAFRLATDMEKCIKDTQNASLAGTLFSPSETSLPDPSRARARRINTLLAYNKFFEPDAMKIATSFNMSMHPLKDARTLLAYAFRRSPRSLLTVMSAYSRGESFSLDLVGAVLRQGSFVQKMYNLGWTHPDRFNQDDTVLKRCIARYHAFLDLMASSPASFFVPTLDIDLAWHTHQLNAERYKFDTITAIKRFIDHDDKVEENSLSNAFDITSRAWECRFKVPYSICGCPLPSASTLSKITSKLGSSSNPSYPPGTILGLTSSTTDADSTHPSEHNSIHVMNHPTAERLREKRQKINRDRLKRDEKLALKGKFDDTLIKRRREDHHQAAFLYPLALMPMYGMYGYPIGMGYGGCAATSGAIVSGDAGCEMGPGSGNTAACATGGCAASMGGNCASGSGAGACGSFSNGACGGGATGCGGGAGGCGGGGGGGGGGGCGGGGC